MENFNGIGKAVFIIGLIIAGIVLVLMFFNKIPFIGKLPGDITIKRENFTVYFPVATSIILSIILSLIFYFLRRK
ncbi:MAG: DUF2905 domain-containing protein [Ignavibacteria bacterium]|nr:DUF2905 domain-containing protein [Ignavibacteria bacterium]